MGKELEGVMANTSLIHELMSLTLKSHKVGPVWVHAHEEVNFPSCVNMRTSWREYSMQYNLRRFPPIMRSRQCG